MTREFVEPRLFYIHGTNGSGKSTLARKLITAAGGVFEGKREDTGVTVSMALFAPVQLVFMGKYANACGGVDGISPYRSAVDTAGILAKQGVSVIMEGLATPGQATCRELSDMYKGNATFFLLDVPEAVCIENVLRRRYRSKRAHSYKPYDPSHLYKKAKSARAWAAALAKNGLDIKVMTPDNVYHHVVKALGLREPTIDQLMS